MKHWRFGENSYCLLKAGDWRAKAAKSTSSSYTFLSAIILEKCLTARYLVMIDDLVEPEIKLNPEHQSLACSRFAPSLLWLNRQL